MAPWAPRGAPASSASAGRDMDRGSPRGRIRERRSRLPRFSPTKPVAAPHFGPRHGRKNPAASPGVAYRAEPVTRVTSRGRRASVWVPVYSRGNRGPEGPSAFPGFARLGRGGSWMDTPEPPPSSAPAAGNARLGKNDWERGRAERRFRPGRLLSLRLLLSPHLVPSRTETLPGFALQLWGACPANTCLTDTCYFPGTRSPDSDGRAPQQERNRQ